MLKIIFFFIFFSLFSMSSFAQFELKTGYVYSRPLGEMSVNIKRSHGIFLQGLYLLPKAPISFGAELGFSGYGHQKTRQTYTFTDGSQTETDVHVNNNILHFQLLAQIAPFRNAPLSPYVEFRGGISRYYTDLTIDDPDDITDCEPLDHDILLSNVGFVGGGALGLKLDLGTLFVRNRNKVFLDLNVTYLKGSNVRYMSIRAPQPNQNISADINARFLNTQHQVVHTHHVGYVYESPIELLEYRFGVMVRF